MAQRKKSIAITGQVSVSEESTTEDQIIKNLHSCDLNDEKSRNGTYFNGAVMAGNVHLVGAVVAKLKKTGEKDLVNWLFENYSIIDKVDQESDFLKTCKSILQFPFIAFMMLILTPFYYMMNSVVCFLIHRSQINFCCSESQNLKYPLFFAGLSGNRDMLQLFIENGTRIDGTDEKGNNIFHYLADLSSYDEKHAIKCYNAVKSFATTEHLPNKHFQNMLSVEKNEDSLTPIEYACKRGNLELGMMMIEDSSECFMKASQEKMYIPTELPAYSPNVFYERDDHNNATDGLKMTTFQSHDPDSVDTMLNYIYERPLSKFNKEELWSSHRNSVIRHQVDKTSQWSFSYYLILNTIVEILLMVGLWLIYDSKVTGPFFTLYSPNKNMFTNEHVQFFLNTWNSSGDVSDSVLQTLFFNQYPDLQILLSNGSYIMDYTEIQDLIRGLPGYQNYTTDNFSHLYDSICVTGSNFFQVGDLAFLDNCTKTVSESLFPVCQERGSSYGYYFKDETMDPYEFILLSTFLGKVYENNVKPISLYYTTPEFFGAIVLIMAFYWAIYIFLDIIVRTKTAAHRQGALFFITHGSSLKAQVKIFCSIAFYVLLFSHLYKLLIPKQALSHAYLKDDLLSYNRNSYLLLNSYQGIFETILFVCQFVSVLHSWICLPGIGSFIIAIFRVGIDFIKFIVIFIFTNWIFSILFSTFVRDQDCPGLDHESHVGTGFLSSFFTTFAVSVGQIILDSNNMKFAYLMHAVFNGFLIMNVIIAVMKETTNNVQREPWMTHSNNSWVYTEYSGIRHYLLTIFCCCFKCSGKKNQVKPLQVKSGEQTEVIEISHIL